MKNAIRIAVTVLSLATASAFALEEPKLVASDFHTGYIPDGFDTNDKVQLVGEGIFSNSCFRPASIDFKVDEAKKEIQLQPSALHYDGMCLQMLVPFHQVLDVGLLKAGTYTVIQSLGSKSLGKLTVKEATSSNPDDFLYAPVSQAYASREANGTHRIKISGSFTSSCMSISNVVVNTKGNVIVVQPISQFVQSGNCVEGRFPFEKSVQLAPTPAGRYLLHVRSLNGQAVNNLIDIN